MLCVVAVVVVLLGWVVSGGGGVLCLPLLCLPVLQPRKKKPRCLLRLLRLLRSSFLYFSKFLPSAAQWTEWLTVVRLLVWDWLCVGTAVAVAAQCYPGRQAPWSVHFFIFFSFFHSLLQWPALWAVSCLEKEKRREYKSVQRCFDCWTAKTGAWCGLPCASSGFYLSKALLCRGGLHYPCDDNSFADCFLLLRMAKSCVDWWPQCHCAVRVGLIFNNSTQDSEWERKIKIFSFAVKICVLKGSLWVLANRGLRPRFPLIIQISQGEIPGWSCQ